MRHDPRIRPLLLLRQPLVMAWLLGSLVSPVALAQPPSVFKWTDAQGVVHYSERPPAGVATQARPMNVKASPRSAAPPQPAASGTDAFAEAFRRQAATPPTAPSRPRPSTPPVVSESQGKEHGTDESRCALARDILKGALRHANGQPIDQHDIDTAQNDVRLFCKKR